MKIEKRGNVLVIGGSGVGKSTLINALLSEDEVEKRQKTAYGIEGTTKEPGIVEPDGVPFRLIDTIGFEMSYFKRREAIKSVKDWSRKSSKEGHEDTQINVIWFCVDGTNSKLFPETIKALASATSIYKSAPMIVAITKSFSKVKREESIELVKKAFSTVKRYRDNMPQIIPVVAEAYPVDESTVVEPQGITELIELTNAMMPAGIKAAQKDIAEYTKTRRQAMAQGLVVASSVAGAATTFVDVFKLTDSVVLNALEQKELWALAKIYKLDKAEHISSFLDKIIEVGGISKIARFAKGEVVEFLAKNTKWKIVDGLVNAGIAAVTIFTIGEISIAAFEQVYSGEKTIDDMDWVSNLFDKEATKTTKENVESLFSQLPDVPTREDVTKAISGLFKKKKKDKDPVVK